MSGRASGGTAAAAAETAAAFGAIVLAGGRGSRLGGVDKAALELAGSRLVDRTVAAARSHGAAPIVIVGPEHTASPGSIVVREDPPFAGPLAALVAGLDALSAGSLPEHVLLLSCDLVDPERVCDALLNAFGAAGPGREADAGLGRPVGRDGVMLRDPDGHRQWLAGLYRTAMLRAAVAAIAGPLENLPLRLAFAGADIGEADAPHSVTADIDAPEDLVRARGLIAEAPADSQDRSTPTHPSDV